MNPSLLRLRALVAGLLLVTMAAAIRAAESNTAIQPEPRDARWVQRHEGFVKIAHEGGVQVLFLGDSITDFWRSRGRAVWDKYFAPLHAANFGISGDRTQHVLWRIEHGELDGLHPKVVVLMIGTNNTGREKNGRPRNTTPEVIAGVTAVVHELRVKLPESKILLLGIFPRGQKGDPVREQIATVNAAIAGLNDGEHVFYLDIGAKFLEPDGTLSRAIMPDLLHPSPKGFEIWAEAINGPLHALLQ